MDLVESSLQSLEWPRLLQLYANYCYSTPGMELALRVQPAESPAEAETLLALTAEALQILEKESFSILSTLPDAKSGLGRLAKEQILDGKELVSIQKLLELSATAKPLLAKYSASAPLLNRLADPVQLLVGERNALAQTFDPDGRVKDTASPRLKTLKQEENKLHAQARERLDQVLQKAFRDGYLQDRFFDVRDGRYLIPVKSEHRLKIPGLVVESSSTKATVFMEPAAVRDLNDRLKQVLLEIEEELYLIFCALCEKLFPHADTLQINYTQLLEIELSLGRARLAQRLAGGKGASRPVFGASLMLDGLYHPLLLQVLDKEKIVRNTFRLEKGQSVLVISGPNTGGKTVILKAVGLSALMARCGFYLPCAGEATIPFFSSVVSQIGDQQNIEQSLSSFSASVANLLAILKVASPKTLILIDEILHSTDPDEAAALSQAILHYFHQMGSTAIVTTHLNGLRVSNSPHFGSASMEFSSDSMRPTYRLRMGVPGSSRAIEIATNLGLPSRIAEEAKTYLGQGQLRYDELLNKLEDKERILAETLERLKEERVKLDAEQARVSSLNTELSSQKLRFQTESKEKLRTQEREATLKLETLIQEYKGKLQDLNAKQEAALEAKSKLKELKESFTPEPSPEPAKEEESFAVSDGFELRGTVYVQHLKNQGILLSDPKDRMRPAEVQVGTLRMRVDWDKLTPLNRKGKPIIRKSTSIDADMDCAPELNVIGQTVDQAIPAVELYVDKAARSGRPSVRIVHGFGSGALQKAIRKLLERNAYGAKMRPGAKHEGGDGCTVLEFGS